MTEKEGKRERKTKREKARYRKNDNIEPVSGCGSSCQTCLSGKQGRKKERMGQRKKERENVTEKERKRERK